MVVLCVTTEAIDAARTRIQQHKIGGKWPSTVR